MYYVPHIFRSCNVYQKGFNKSEISERYCLFNEHLCVCVCIQT